MSEQDQDSVPAVPAALIEAIKAYGDARAAGDTVRSTEQLAACITSVQETLLPDPYISQGRRPLLTDIHIEPLFHDEPFWDDILQDVFSETDAHDCLRLSGFVCLTDKGRVRYPILKVHMPHPHTPFIAFFVDPGEDRFVDEEDAETIATAITDINSWYSWRFIAVTLCSNNEFDLGTRDDMRKYGLSWVSPPPKLILNETFWGDGGGHPDCDPVMPSGLFEYHVIPSLYHNRNQARSKGFNRFTRIFRSHYENFCAQYGDGLDPSTIQDIPRRKLFDEVARCIRTIEDEITPQNNTDNGFNKDDLFGPAP